MVSYKIRTVLLLASNLYYAKFTQLKYPSALASFEKITSYAKGKRVVLFLDYDGTLSPIVDNPDRAFMSNNVRIYCVVSTLLVFFSYFVVNFKI